MMHKILIASWLIGAAFTAHAALGQISASAQSQSISGTATVIDGDTIEIHGERIRLGGFDAPESGAYCGRTNAYNRAAHALSELISSRPVICQVTGRDSYGRTTANCTVSGLDLGDQMVRGGWARDWPRYSRGRYANAEAAARSARAGIWGMNCPANLWRNRDYSPSSTQPEQQPSPPSAELRFVNASSLNIRVGASGEHSVVGRLRRGAPVTILERAGEWARIAASSEHGEGWVSDRYLAHEIPPAPTSSEAEIRRTLMEQSIAYYSGSCPCPYNVDRGGRRCGARSAYSRPGGARPLCYPSDVSDAQIEAYRARAP